MAKLNPWWPSKSSDHYYTEEKIFYQICSKRLFIFQEQKNYTVHHLHCSWHITDSNPYSQYCTGYDTYANMYNILTYTNRNEHLDGKILRSWINETIHDQIPVKVHLR